MRIQSSVSLQSRSGTLSAGLRRKLGSVVGKAAHDVEAHAKASILGGTKSGRVYGAHQASAPGEAPANDLGVLAASIITEKTGDLTRTVVAGAEYAAAEELGTVRMAPRPFMTPAVDAARPGFLRAIEKTLEQG